MDATLYIKELLATPVAAVYPTWPVRIKRRGWSEWRFGSWL
jgi:hypothetical protein